MFRDSPRIKGAIKHQIKARGLTVTSLAKELKLDRKRIYALLNDDYSVYRPTQEAVWRICDYLGISVTLKIVIDEGDS